MHTTTKALIASCVLFAAGYSNAATINGFFTYDDQDVDSVFSDLSGATVLAENPSDSTSVYGTVNLASGTFEIEDVTVGSSISLWLVVDRNNSSAGAIPDAGDLYAGGVVSVSSPGDVIAVTMDLAYTVHITAPVDSSQTVDGFFGQCPVGAETASPTTVTWEAVPRATSYSVQVNRRACDYSTIHQEVFEQTSTSLDLTLGTHSEDHVEVRVRCSGSSGNLCYLPWVMYQDNFVQGYFLHAGGGGDPRGTDHANAHFIPAVARAAGVPPTFWSTELVILNMQGPQIVEVVFTPRNKDGWTNYDSTFIKFPGYAARSYPDVLDYFWGRDGAGSLEVRGSGLVVSTRTSTPAVSGGSYGLSVPPIAPDDLLMAGGTTEAFAGGVREDDNWRTNFGVCEVSGRSITVRVTVYDDSMNALGERTITLGPYENKQITRVVRALTNKIAVKDEHEDFYIVGVEVLAGSGEVGAYLTLIEFTTGDSTYIPVAPQTPTGG